MRIEIISFGETSVYTMPEKVDFVGLTIENTTRTLNIVTGIPDGLDNLSVECTQWEQRLNEELTLTAHLYTLGEKARSLSWKPYSDFLFYDLHLSGVNIKAYG